MRSIAWERRRSLRPIFTPFLDAEFWELCLSLNPNELVEGGRQKAVLRNAAGDRLLESCRERPKLGGFDPLVERGLADRGAWRVYELFQNPRLRSWSAFDGVAFLRAFESYRSGRDDSLSSYRGSWPVWRTVATEMWLQSMHKAPPKI